MAIPANVTGPRLRAARAFARLEREDVAEALGVSPRTYSRMEAGEREVDSDGLRQAAIRCGVPASFMEFGFPRESQTPAETLERRVSALEAERQQALAQTAQELAARVAAELGIELPPKPQADDATQNRREAS